MTQIVGQADGFDEIFIQTKGPSDRPCNLTSLQGVSETSPVVISFMVDENLGLVLQPAKGGGMDDSVTVPLESGANFVFLLRPSPSAGIPASDRIGS